MEDVYVLKLITGELLVAEALSSDEYENPAVIVFDYQNNNVQMAPYIIYSDENSCIIDTNKIVSKFVANRTITKMYEDFLQRLRASKSGLIV